MKRGILVATLVLAAAGVAGAQLLTSASHGVAPSAHAAAPAAAPIQAQVPLAAPTRAAEPVAVPAPKPVPAPTVQKASIETRQAPVPLLVKPRPPVDLPAVDAAAATPATAANTEQAAATDNAAGESVAKSAIEADGYKGVKVIRKGENGMWYAKAMRGKTEVTLIVDASGSVSAE